MTPAQSRTGRRMFVVSDVHGHRDELATALHLRGLTGEQGEWTGADSRLWFLGDYVDRGPDGVGVLDDIRRLAGEAAAAGGEVGALLGNHEAKLLAAHRFGDRPVPELDEPDGHLGSWLRYGGQRADLLRLGPEHVAWLESLPALARVGRYLLMHADTARYLEFGPTLEAANRAVHRELTGRDPSAWLDFGRRLADRGAFRPAGPAQPGDAANRLLAAFGGEMIVHGHTTLSKLTDRPPAKVDEPHRYAAGRVLAIDGGVHEGGPMLVTPLP